MDALVRKLQRENDEELLEDARKQPILASLSAATGEWYAIVAYESANGEADYGSLRVACWGIFELPVDPDLRFCAPVVCDEGQMLNAETLPGYLGLASGLDDVEQEHWLELAKEWVRTQQRPTPAPPSA